MYVAGMPRSESAGLPPPPTYIANAWKRPAFGACYDLQTPFGELPFQNANLKRAARLEEEGKQLRRSAVRYPVSVNQLWDPQPEETEWPDYDSEAVTQARLSLWKASKDAHGRPSAAEALYSSRQPDVPVTDATMPTLQTKLKSDPVDPDARPSSSVCSDEDGIYFVLRCMRMGVFPNKMRHDFGFKQKTAARVFRSYVRAMAEALRREFPKPTQAEVFASTPVEFNETAGRSDIELILDATGVTVGHPSNPEVARQLWSEYYHAYSCVYQIGITPGGCGVFASMGLPPKLTDTQQTIYSGALESVSRGSCVQVDKGYDGLKRYAARRGIDVDMPVKKRRKQKNTEKNRPMAREGVRRSRRTARTRIHVEREMIRVSKHLKETLFAPPLFTWMCVSQIKNYRIFTQTIPLEYKDVLDDMIWIAVCLGNYGVGLTSTEWKETVGSASKRSSKSKKGGGKKKRQKK
jgi:hypothetical protein